jgi:hemerythrin
MNLNIPTLGVAAIDRDHRDAAELLEAAAAPGADIKEMAARLLAHCREHFAREEALMAECGFFAAHCHAEEHRRVLAEAEAAALGREAEARDYVLGVFPRWLVEHAATMDTVTMSAWLAHKGA